MNLPTPNFDEPVLYEMAAKSSWYNPSTILRAGDSNLSGTGDDRSVTDVSWKNLPFLKLLVVVVRPCSTRAVY